MLRILAISRGRRLCCSDLLIVWLLFFTHVRVLRILAISRGRRLCCSDLLIVWLLFFTHVHVLRILAISRGRRLCCSDLLIVWLLFFTHVRVLRILAISRGRRLCCSDLLIVWLLFEGIYSRMASIRGWRLFEDGVYSRMGVASIRRWRLFIVGDINHSAYKIVLIYMYKHSSEGVLPYVINISPKQYVIVVASSIRYQLREYIVNTDKQPNVGDYITSKHCTSLYCG